MKIAAIYTRKSKYTGKGESIANQVKLCKEYLHRKDIDDFIIYEDEGFSGKNLNRPQFKKLMSDAKRKRFDILICYRLDRVSRNIADFSSLIQELESFGVDFISVSESFDTSTPMGRAMMYIASVFSQLERETISERIRDNMIELAKSGRWLGGTTPTGFKSIPVSLMDENLNERKIFSLTPVEHELNLVKLIFAKYLEFKSLNQVSKFLLSNNIQTKNGNDWSKTTIQTILNNPAYVRCDGSVIDYLKARNTVVLGTPNSMNGLLSYNKRIGKNGKYRSQDEWIYAVSNFEGIISSEDWISAQKLLKSNHRESASLGKNPVALLTGLIRCKDCGGPMRISYGKLSKKTGIKPYYYACSMKYNSGGTRCKSKNAPGALLDEIVLDKLKELTMDTGAFVKKLQEQKKLINLSNSFTDKERQLKSSIDSNRTAVDNLLKTLSFTSNESTSKLLLTKLDSLNEEKKSLEKELKELSFKHEDAEDEIFDISALIQSLSNFGTAVDNLKNIEDKRYLIGTLVEKIIWDGKSGLVDIKFWGADKKK